MYAEVIPQLRTLPHLKAFDYQVPSTFNVHPGDLVQIDFRSNKYTGLVLKTKTSTRAKKVKSIEKIIDSYKFSETQLKFLQWFADYYKISPALALKTIFPEIPQKKHSLDLPQASSPKKKIFISKNRLPEIKKVLKATNHHLIHYNNFNEKIAFYTGLIKKSKQTLLIIPEKKDVLNIASHLKQFNPLIIDSSLSKNQAWETWLSIKSNKSKLIIGTKSSIFIPPDNLDQIIIDDEENKSHKNFDQNPRYHVIACAEKIAELNKAKLTLTSQSPSIESNYKYKKQDLLVRTEHRSVQLINLDDERQKKNYTWFSEELITNIKNKKSLLIFNRKGQAKLIVCKDCHEVFPFQKTLSCPSCKGQNIKTAGHGTGKLIEELRQLLPNKKIVQVDKETPLPPNQEWDIIFGTEYALNVLDLDKIEFIGILSVDHQLVQPDFRAQERTYQLITKLINLNKPLLLQTNSPENPVIQAAIHQNYKYFYEEELKNRKILNYPPFGNPIKQIKKNKHTLIDYV